MIFLTQLFNLLLLIFSVPVQNIRKSPIQYEKLEDTLFPMDNEDYQNVIENLFNAFVNSNKSKSHPQAPEHGRQNDNSDKALKNTAVNVVQWFKGKSVHSDTIAKQTEVSKPPPYHKEENLKLYKEIIPKPDKQENSEPDKKEKLEREIEEEHLKTDEDYELNGNNHNTYNV